MEAQHAAPARSRSWWGPVRLLVSFGLLALLLTKIKFATLIPHGRSLPGTLAFLVAGILLMALSMIVAAWRWQRVLVVFGKSVPMRHLIADYFAGQFVGNVLPSTIGGDVVRIARVSGDVGGTDTAFASVVLERLTGFVSLPLLIVIGFAIRPELAGTTNGWIAILTGAGTVVVFGLILVVCGHPALAGRFTEHQNWMRYIGAIHIGVDRMRRQPRHAAIVLALADPLPARGRLGDLLRVPHHRADRPERGGDRLRARGGDGAGAADLSQRSGVAGGDARLVAPPARREDRPGGRSRACSGTRCCWWSAWPARRSFAIGSRRPAPVQPAAAEPA